MEKKYTALRIISLFYKILGVIIGIVTILGIVFTIIAQPAIDFGNGFRLGGGAVLIFAIVGALLELVFGGLIALGTYALGDLISVLMNIEENTRFTALIMRDRMAPPQPMQPMAPPPMQQPVQPPSYQVPPPPPYQQP
jgi:hypothetical protein